ncbi:hypothetical protein [Hathewaya limosa]|uniref:Uncharacterized protein n=1 Tax=Hathewaya limosa TaxID=1536 RepID=A0ABU0JTI7_HATLI|nr:hypothetical protein [Hathewaya limosa]MDQ0479232.1 hypothetical protein [Hathewaya limosa]
MELRLNKIDPELRREINEKTKSDKVHTKDEISISNDLKKENKNKFYYFNEKNNKRVLVDGEQELEDVPKEIHKGLLIDKRT